MTSHTTSSHAPGAATSGDELVASIDTGARNPVGWQAWLIPGIAFIWSLFQLYVISPLPFIVTERGALPGHLQQHRDPRDPPRLRAGARGDGLPALLQGRARPHPVVRLPPRDRAAPSCASTSSFNADQIARRSGLPTTTDLVVSTLGPRSSSASRSTARSGCRSSSSSRSSSPTSSSARPTVFPDVMRWAGASYDKAMWHFWMQTEGVFGVALGVSATLIFLFVLFGAILERAGAGNFFIQIAFGLLGHLRGGPAKAAVVASGLSGIYSGSSIANVVTTGTFTIPLMKKTGFPAEKAGAVEVASSTNGQLTPPVMGAAAFLIAEFTGTAYTDLIVYAFLPAIVSYIALLYIVHLEALKLGLKGLPSHVDTKAKSTARKLRRLPRGLLRHLRARPRRPLRTRLPAARSSPAAALVRRC